jgi:hypothetical protein
VVVLSLLVLAAHFLRAGALPVVGALLLLVALLFVRRPWAARTIQIVLVLGALEWLRTLYLLAGVRIDSGEPFLRLVLILGAVALVTLIAALSFQTRSLRRVYGIGSDSGS